MQEQSLHDFYQHAVLPQFGIKELSIEWQNCQDLGADGTAHYFHINGQDYVLIFEDHDGKGRDNEYIEEFVLDHPRDYEFVEPASETSVAPSYDGFKLPTAYTYIRNITGTYTLLKLN